MASRRRLLEHLAAVSSALGLTGCARLLRQRGTSYGGELPPNPRAGDLPGRQHAWNDVLRRDSTGNVLAPRHHRVLLLDLDVDPSDDTAKTIERAMRSLEGAYVWSPDGLLHMLAWGSAYFERIGRLGPSPVRKPRVLSRTDNPVLQEFDAALVLASDVPSHLAATERAMFGNRQTLGDDDVTARLGDVFSVAVRRTGFIGEGLPAAHTDAEGIPREIPDEVSMFTGFFSGRRNTQASEGRVTIQDGRYAEGTTMHLSHLTESLDDWWTALDDDGRVARMFSPEFSPDDVADFASDVPFSDAVREHAQEFGVVGHHEKVARARENGRPIVLRRDFNTVDGGQAGVHFLSLQRELSDFEKTRRAMNGWYLRDDHPDVTDRSNNGLLNFISVASRANFYVPPRAERALPS